MPAPLLVRGDRSKESFDRQGELRQPQSRMALPNKYMSFQQDSHHLQDTSFAQPVSSAVFGSYPQNQILTDEWHCPYIVVGENEVGEWRRYIVDGMYDEPSFWPLQSTHFAGQDLAPYHSYTQSQVQGQGSYGCSSDKGSARQTPRPTPELDTPNIDFQITSSNKRKRTTKAKDKQKRSTLERPLSELTKHLTHIPIKDMEAWVKRSTEERRNEKRQDGTIKRPSNSFMLYRSAFTERCREWEKSKNHQDISSTAGASWKIETPEVRRQFEEWAKLERENHQKAFPDYKFQPQTQAAKDRKRKQKSDETSEDVSDDDDPTYRRGRGDTQARARAIRTKNPRTTYREFSDSPSFPSSDEVDTPESYLPFDNASPYFTNVDGGKPLPTAMDRAVQPGDYYITSHPNQAEYGRMAPFDTAGTADEAAYYSADPQVVEYASSSPPMGLPGISHDDLVGGMPVGGPQMMLAGTSLLDPDLDGPHGLGVFGGDVETLLPPPSARSNGFHASDYLKDGDGMPYLSQFAHDDAL